MIIKSNLKELREKKGISKYKLWKDTGLNRPLLDKIENGTIQEIPVPALMILCKYFRVPIQKIISIVEGENNNDDLSELAIAS